MLGDVEWLNVLSLLDYRTLVKMSFVDSNFNRLALDHSLWKNIIYPYLEVHSKEDFTDKYKYFRRALKKQRGDGVIFYSIDNSTFGRHEFGIISSFFPQIIILIKV